MINKIRRWRLTICCKKNCKNIKCSRLRPTILKHWNDLKCFEWKLNDFHGARHTNNPHQVGWEHKQPHQDMGGAQTQSNSPIKMSGVWTAPIKMGGARTAPIEMGGAWMVPCLMKGEEVNLQMLNLQTRQLVWKWWMEVSWKQDDPIWNNVRKFRTRSRRSRWHSERDDRSWDDVLKFRTRSPSLRWCSEV